MKRFLGLDFSIERGDAVKAGKFILFTAVVFAVLSILFSFIPIEIFENFFAYLSLFFLNILGIGGKIVQGEPVLILLHNYDFPIAITYLCTGLLEMLILASVIIASFGVGAKEKILGIIAALVAIVIFNTFRIVATVLMILNLDLQTAELSHNILFRIFLFLVIAGFYFVWFMWAVKRSSAL